MNTNGDLLKLAEEEFDCFITSDQNIRYQQRLVGRKIAILELSTNDLRRIVSAGEEIRGAIANIKTGEFLQLSIP